MRTFSPQRDSPGGFQNSTSRGTQPNVVGKSGNASQGQTCARCGAWRGELGQEPTVERYIADLVSVFDAVRRVLRRDGLCWVNLSGSFASTPGGQNGATGRVSARAIEANRQAGRQKRIGAARSAGNGSWLKPLDWVDTPGLFAHAMVRAGWYWRADIALVKKSPLPESVQGWQWERCKVKVAAAPRSAQPRKSQAYDGLNQNPQGATATVNGETVFASAAEWADCPGCSRCAPNDGLILRRGNGRPTRAWERFLIFAKAPGAYFDSEAVREPMAASSEARYAYAFGGSKSETLLESGQVHTRPSGDREYNPAGRNLKDWQFWPTRGGVGGLQHYAAYPIPLAELAIRAGTSERGVCGTCGAPWARVVERTSMVIRRSDWGEKAGNRTATSGTMLAPPTSETTGWRPTCLCNAGTPVPAVVLDSFVGSGSTLLAADRLGRDAIGIDVQPTYIDLAAGRARRDAPLFATVEVERQAEQAAKQRDLFSVLDELQEGVTNAAG